MAADMQRMWQRMQRIGCCVCVGVDREEGQRMWQRMQRIGYCVCIGVDRE